MRRENRNFRLDRMEEVVLLNQVFARPPDFKIRFSDEEDRTVVVRVLFDHETAPRIKETPSLFQVAQEAHPDGLLVTLTVRRSPARRHPELAAQLGITCARVGARIAV